MFFNTRLRLTLWYLAIVAIVSFSFSWIIYRGVITDLERGFMMAEARLTAQGIITPRRIIALNILGEDFEKAKKTVAIRLISINGIILAASGIAAYILAGKTLEPLREAMDEQKRFAADASHELKTPLTALRTELEVALRDKKLSLENARNMLKSNLEEVINLQNLSENLMKLNRYSQNVNGIKFEKISISEVVDQAVKKVLPLARKKSIHFTKEVKEIVINADKLSLTELLVILLDNAVKYSPNKSTVTISTAAQRNKIALMVSDYGVGIAKRDIPNLFNRFYRADSSRTKNAADGYGLGLAIAREIVEKHKGEISVRSKLGEGTTFKIVLPK